MARRVIVIDDSETDLLFARLMLERSGLAVEAEYFESARDALERLRDPARPRPDLLLLDINMPGMDGFEFLAAHDAPGCVPVVMLSTSGDPADRARAAGHACVRGYLTKPLSRQDARDLGRLLP